MERSKKEIEDKQKGRVYRMIKIKMNNGKWRIEVEEEKWEFSQQKPFEDCLKELLKFKALFGQIK